MKAAYQRVLTATGCRTQNELASFLGIRQTFVVDALRRGAIPPAWLEKLRQANGTNPEWILSGTPPQRLRLKA